MLQNLKRLTNYQQLRNGSRDGEDGNGLRKGGIRNGY